jgi:cadmium resistance protein CadD (predicted permease)
MVGVAVAAFVSTNLDNLFLLMALMGGSQVRTSVVAAAYAAAIALVVTLGLAGSFAADFVSNEWLRALGLVPLGMGIWRLKGLLGREPAEHAEHAETQRPAAGGVSVFGVMLANSGDSLGVFASLMGETSERLEIVVIATALAMSGVWVLAARWIVEHPGLAPLLRRVDRYLVPALLIAIGLYILFDTPTDTV